MKTLILLSLMGYFLTPAFANTAIKLSCSKRKDVLISKFDYHLATMKWGNHFQVAAGEVHARTANNEPYTLTHFQNGDELVELPHSHRYVMFYSQNEHPDPCRFRGAYAYPVTELPIVNNSGTRSRRRK